MEEKRIILAHGGGGLMMNRLIRKLFVARFGSSELSKQSDSAILPSPGNRLSFTTDSFVVDPLFFPGGDIGKLAVCGILNDLAVSGATPKYLAIAFILEEGLLICELETIVSSIAEAAREAGVSIVTGDTKVVPRGKGDKIFITTTGIGEIPDELSDIGTGDKVTPGDHILVNGTLGDHGIAVLLKRESFEFRSTVHSDCANLYPLIHKVVTVCPGICFMRDATRGGVATVLCELAENRVFGIELDEKAIPVNPAVSGVCELLGLDPLYVANEGKAIFVAPESCSQAVLEQMRKDPLGKDAAIIGRVTAEYPGMVTMKTSLGGYRWIDYISGDQLPRIC